MPRVPGTSSMPAGGSRARKATQLKAQMEANKRDAEQKAKAAAAGAEWRPVKASETLEQIAAETGRSADQIWNDPLNKQLRDRLADDPSKLAPGDALYIPPAEEEETGTGPVGQGDYVVKQGDCTASIAVNTGHFWETIWNDPANRELKEVRKDPYTLLPGDRVTIPELRPKQEPGETEMRHRFVRKGCPEKLVIRFLVNDKPRANQAYTLEIDGQLFEGITDPNGRLEALIPPDAEEGKIVFPESGDEYRLQLGDMDPITEISGVQGRLNNLGFFDGPLDGEMSDKLEQAIRDFQEQNALEPTGKLDETTRNKIQQAHAG